MRDRWRGAPPPHLLRAQRFSCSFQDPWGEPEDTTAAAPPSPASPAAPAGERGSWPVGRALPSGPAACSVAQALCVPCVSPDAGSQGERACLTDSARHHMRVQGSRGGQSCPLPRGRGQPWGGERHCAPAAWPPAAAQEPTWLQSQAHSGAGCAELCNPSLRLVGQEAEGPQGAPGSGPASSIQLQSR